MAGNAPGGNGAERDKDMEAFDRLPPELRRMLANAPYPFSSPSMEVRARSYTSPMAFVDFCMVSVFPQFRDQMLKALWPAGHPMIGQGIADDWNERLSRAKRRNCAISQTDPNACLSRK